MTPTPSPHPFKSVQFLTATVKTLLVVGAVIKGLSLVVILLSTAATPFTEETVGENPTGFAIAMVEFGLGTTSILVYLGTAVCFLIWLYRCYRNLPAFGNPKRSINYSPGWTIGFWFIPFVNLVAPYKIVKETWEKSLPYHERPSLDEGSPSFLLWWTFWLLAIFSSNLYRRAVMRGEADPTYVTIVGVVAYATSILAAIFVIAIVSDIGKRQEESSKALKLGAHQLPPLPPVLSGLPSATLNQQPHN